GRSAAAGLQLPRGQRLRGQERRQLLRLFPGLRERGRPAGPGRRAGALRGDRHGLGVRLPRDPGLQLCTEPLRTRGTAPGAAAMTATLPDRVELTLPGWLPGAVAGTGAVAGDEAKAALA